jgi:hypothetical protein
MERKRTSILHFWRDGQKRTITTLKTLRTPTTTLLSLISVLKVFGVVMR